MTANVYRSPKHVVWNPRKVTEEDIAKFFMRCMKEDGKVRGS
jgi:hypothetical protein